MVMALAGVGLLVERDHASAAAPQSVQVLVVKATRGPQPVPNVQDLTGPTVTFYAKASFGAV